MISDTLGREPNIVWKAGDPRCTPTGAALEGVYPHTYWVWRLHRGDAEELEETLCTDLDHLERHSEFFTQLTLEGGSAEYFIGWFSGRNSGTELSAPLLARLGRLGVQLSLDIYGSIDFIRRD